MNRNPPPPPPHTSTAGTSGTAAAAAAATVCTNCCSDDQWSLHCVQLRGLYRKLCTSCVLKLHPTSFCPTCFSLHELPTSVSNTKMLTCFKCSSVSHSTCVPPNVPRSPYLCPFCFNPSLKVFDFRKATRKNQESGDGDGSNSKVPEGGQFLDERAAKVLFAAARIAAISMTKAAVTVKAEADKKVREAALARKRSKEAIDYVIALSARVGIDKPPAQVSDSVSLKGPIVMPVKLDEDGGIGRGNNVAGGGAAIVVNPPENKNVEQSNLNMPHLQSDNSGSDDHVGGKDGTG